MGEDVKDKAKYLRNAVTFQSEFLSSIKEGTKFYIKLMK
jgi:hypothetical protein